MQQIFLIPALVVAFLALRGWPSEWDAWGRALIALFSLVAGLLTMALLAPSSDNARFRAARKPSAFNRIARATSIAFLLVIAYFILAQGPEITRQLSYYLASSSEAQFDASLEEEDEDIASDSDLNSSLSENVEEAGVGTVFDPTGATVPNSASLAPSDEPQVSLILPTAEAASRLHRSGSIYLSSFSHSNFDGSRWTSQDPVNARIVTADRNGLILLRKSRSQQPTYRYTVLHDRIQSGLNTVNTLQGVGHVRLPELTRLAPGTNLLPALDQRTSSYQYEAASSPKRFTSLVEDKLPIATGATEPAYQAPAGHAGLHQQIQRLSTRFSQGVPLEERLIELQHWLRNTYSYSLVVNYPENGKSPIENFLGNPDSNTRTGFCVHFASAAALFARELGVPSRICYGWTGGQFYEEHSQFVFGSEHAHAWTEIFLEDHGWVIFDTTPTSALPQTSESAEGEVPPMLMVIGSEEMKEDVEENGSGFPFENEWILIACGTAVAILAIFLAFKRKRSRGDTGQNNSTGSAPTHGYLRLFHQNCIRLGHAMQSGRTLFQFLEALKSQDVPIHFADELLTYHYDITYRNCPRSSQLEKRLCDQIRSWNPGS
jgi:hypothetical protein